MPVWLSVVLGVWLIPAAITFLLLFFRIFDPRFSVRFQNRQVRNIVSRLLVVMFLSLFWFRLEMN